MMMLDIDFAHYLAHFVCIIFPPLILFNLVPNLMILKAILVREWKVKFYHLQFHCCTIMIKYIYIDISHTTYHSWLCFLPLSHSQLLITLAFSFSFSCFVAIYLRHIGNIFHVTANRMPYLLFIHKVHLLLIVRCHIF